MKTKRVITFLLIAFILASCAPVVEVVPTVTVVPTSIFTPVPTAPITPTPIPSTATSSVPEIKVGKVRIEYPSFAIIEEAYKKFGLENPVTSEKLIYDHPKLKLNDPEDSSILFARDPSGGKIILATRYNSPNKQFQWHVFGLRDFGDSQGIRIGTMIPSGVFREQSADIQAAVKSEFGFFTPPGVFENRWWNPYGPLKAFQDSKNNNLGLRIQQVYWPSIDYPNGVNSPQLAEKYIEKRSDDIISIIKAQKGDNPIDIVLYNEPLMNYRGVQGWMEDDFTKQLGGTKKAILKSYVSLYKKAISMGLTPGIDFNIIGVNIAGLEANSTFTDFAIKNIIEIKQEIAIQINIPVEKVVFDIGLQFHLGQTKGNRNTTLSLPIDKKALINQLVIINAKTGSKIDLTEIDALGSENAIAEAYAVLIESAVESGVVSSMNFWSTFDAKSNSEWQNPLFSSDIKRGLVYEIVMEKIFQLIK